MKNLYKWILSLFFAFAVQYSLNAQTTQPMQTSQASSKLEGVVLDSLTRQPLPYTTIVLFAENSSVPTTGNTTNEKGAFKLEKIPVGTYRLNIESLGYARKIVRQVVLSAQVPRVELSTILLSPAAQQLQEVTVTGQAPVYENRLDRLVYNPEQDIMGTNGDAAELLRRVPTLSVDMNGNVALRGNRNVRVLIDGKPSGAMAGNIGDLLQSIPAAQIKSIEVITSPSAKYDSEGSGGIINIITRKKNRDGINGSINAGIGTRQLNGSMSLSGRINKLMIDFNAGINNKWPRLVGVDFYSYDASGNNSSTKGTTLNTRLSNNASAILQYIFDNKNSISSTFRQTSLGYNDDMNTASVNKSVGHDIIRYGLYSESQFRLRGFDWSGDYLHQFKKEGAELSIAAQWSQNTSTRNYRALYSNGFASQEANNRGKNNEYTVQADYTLPISKMLKLETGIKGIFRPITSTYVYATPDSLGRNGNAPFASNLFNYQQQVYAGYVVLQLSLAKGWTFQAGNRLESTYIIGSSENASAGILPFNNQYTNFLPNLILAKKLKDDNTIQLGYNTRIQRPSLQFLNPFRNTNDPLNQSQGTPELAPERVQTVEISYSNIIKSVNINASVYYKKTNDIIESFVETVPYTITDATGGLTTRNVSLTRYGNIGFINSVGFNLFNSVNLGKKVSLRSSFNAYTYHPQVKAEYNSFLNPGTFFQYNGFAGITCKLPSELSLETFYSFQSKERTFQGTTANLNVWSIGVKKNIFKQQGSIGIAVVNLMRNNWDFTDYISTSAITQYNNFSTPFRSFNFNASYKFGSNPTKSAARRGVNNNDLKEHSN